MNGKKRSLIYEIISLILTLGAVFLVAMLASNGGVEIFKILLMFLAGLIIFGILFSVIHELGHVIAGKKNKMAFVSMRVGFVSFVKVKGKVKLMLANANESAGATTMIPKSYENLAKRFKNQTLGGLIGSLICLIISIVLICLRSVFTPYLYAFLAVSFAVAIYSFFNNAFPISEDGVMSDGAVLLSLKRQDDTSKVLLSVLTITAELYNGKSPAEIDKGLFFSVPQLPEDDVNFATILTYRYAYYLDNGEISEAVKIAQRIESILEFMPKAIKKQLMVELVYVASYLNKNEYDADDYMDEVEKIVNSDNSLTNLRVKSAYLLFILDEKERALEFINKGLEDAKDWQIKGIGKYEEKLLKDLKEKAENN